MEAITNPIKQRLKPKLVSAAYRVLPKSTILKYIPADAGQKNMLIARSRDESPDLCELGLPVPPEAFWRGLGANRKEYLNVGKEHVENMRAALKKNNIETPDTILDFGCGAGRMIRWLKPEAERGVVWGCDIGAEHIQWLQRNLRPPFRFFTNTTMPILPFTDGYFGLVYAGSVFTHIADLAQAWLLEVRRIIRPGGIAYLTIHDKETEVRMRKPLYEQTSPLPEILDAYGKLPNNLGLLALGRWPETGGTNVFYSHEFWRESLTPMFEILDIVPGAYGYQTAFVARAV
jgi:SAM-dependent methyltransferase